MKKMFFILLAFALSLSLGVYAQEQTKEETAKEETTVQESEITVEAEICSDIADRMPVGVAETFPADAEKLYLWSKVTGAQDTTHITHVWYREGEELARVQLPVKSPSWRTWSSKIILPIWTGDWKVEVLGPDDKVLKTVSFKVE